MSTLQSLVDDWLERSADDEPRTVRPGYDRTFSLPRPRLNEFGICFRCDSQGPLGRIFHVSAIMDDGELVIGPNGKPYEVEIGCEVIGRYINSLLLAIDSDVHALLDRMEAAYHGSDEAMRATHPREL